MKRYKTEKIRDWAIVFSYALLIYISLPMMPGLWEKFTRYTGNFADYVAPFILGFIGLSVIYYLISRQKGIRSFIWLLILASAYAWGLSRLELSIERVHFLEYGLLSLFVFRALRHNIRDKSIYLWSGIAVFCLGFLDEGIQYILPNRVYETKDVIINGFAGILGLFLIGLCFQPKLENLTWSK
ncbi:VanZ family protein [Patescibacteria group bacterium]|nr:VanZ family protein [Patescibacteria group bacterium]